MRLLFLFLLSLSAHPLFAENQGLQKEEPLHSSFATSPFSVAILVDARHFDYTDGARFLRSFFDGDDSKFGHAWICLRGIKEGKHIFIEGGHSGELGMVYPRYLDLVIGGALRGEKDPIRHIYARRDDGYFETGSGGHKPTFAIGKSITEEQFDAIYKLIESGYQFSQYSLLDNQCISFAACVGEVIGLCLEHQVDLKIPQSILFDGKKLTLWEDGQYRSIRISTPDVLEQSMMQQVREGNACFVLDWYKALGQAP